jgi:hypothetical protein
LVTTLRRRSALTFTLGTLRTIAGGYLAGTPRGPLPVTFEKLRVFFSQGPKLDFHSGNANELGVGELATILSEKAPILREDLSLGRYPQNSHLTSRYWTPL